MGCRDEDYGRFWLGCWHAREDVADFLEEGGAAASDGVVILCEEDFGSDLNEAGEAAA